MGVVVAHPHSLAKGIGRKPGQVAGRVTDALEKLGDDRAGVSARAVEKRIGNGGQQGTEVFIAIAIENAECRSERQGKVGAGIAVCDRENVDAVQQLLLPEYAVDAGAQRYGKRISIKVLGSLVRQQSVPSRAAAGSLCRCDSAPRRPE